MDKVTQLKLKFPQFSGDMWVDVVIVGAGISGLTAALLLKQQGLTVALLEKSTVGTGESGHTTAHITEVIDTRYKTLISKFGETGARKAAQSSRDAIECIQSWIKKYRINCAFQRVPAFIYSENPDEADDLKQEMEAMRRAGVEAEMATGLPPELRARTAIKVSEQAQFQPYKYFVALSRLVDGDGCHVFENTTVTEIQDGRPCEITTEHGRLRCGNVIVTAHTPFNNRVFLHTKISNYRTYAIAARLADEKPLQGLFWDTMNPYHYIRSQTLTPDEGGGEVLIVGGEDHKVGTSEDTEECFQRLEAFTRERFNVGDFKWRWSGQILEPADGLPYIGLNSLSEHVYVATGYTGNGMTFGTFAGMLLSDLVLGHPNKCTDLYDATRIKPIAAAYEFVSHNLDVAKQYVGDWLSRGEVDSVQEIAPEHGKLVTVNGRKVAVYRDDAGGIHALSPVCPHLGCQVHWNSAEKSWDCPCHGSRFTCKGEVVNGPAVDNLQPVDLEKLAQGEKDADAPIPEAPVKTPESARGSDV